MRASHPSVDGTSHPLVDVNLFVHNGEATVAAAIESVLAQTWPSLRLTLIDNCSTDSTPDMLAHYAAASAAGGIQVSVLRNRANVGPVLNCQRAFWAGTADFVMPKTADDLLAPNYVARIMGHLLDHEQTAMCHAGGLVFTGSGEVRAVYPPEHSLSATGNDPVARAAHVMSRYTSAPAFWGIYRRDRTDLLRRISYRAGWDHAVLAELALYGEIRSVPDVLYWRRDGGKPVDALARGCTEFAQRNLPLDDELAELRWRTPLITTAYNHVETFAAARVDAPTRHRLMAETPAIFRARWLPLLRREAASFRALLTDLLADFEDPAATPWQAQQLTDAIYAIATILPDEDFSDAHLRLALQRTAVSA
jgi:glycosyltransferase involved in cell wall biosynthesis